MKASIVFVVADSYRDSIELMRVAASIEALPNISRCSIMMGSKANKEMMIGSG